MVKVVKGVLIEWLIFVIYYTKIQTKLFLDFEQFQT